MSLMNLVADSPRERRRLAWDDLLARHRLFAGFSKSEIERLAGAEASAERTVAAGEAVVEQGQPGDSVFFVGKGSVKVSFAEPGQVPFELGVLRKGDFFGEMVLFEPGPRSATVTAVHECVLLEVSSEALQDLMILHPALELALLHTMTDRLRNTNERILSLKLREAPEALRLLEARLSAEVRVFDASLKAAHTVFEQTRARTDEVIGNADRARSRLTYVGSTIASFFTLAGMALGGLGLRDVWSLQNKAAKAIEASATFETESARVKEQIRGIDQMTAVARDILVRDQVVPALQNALAEGAPLKAKACFERLDQLGWVNEENVFALLYQIEDAMVAPRDASGALAKAPVEAAATRQDFTELLSLMAERAKQPETQAKAYSLFLANSILVDKPSGEREPALERFRSLLAQHKEQRLLGRETWKALDQRLGQAGEAKRDAFQQIRRLIPTGG